MMYSTALFACKYLFNAESLFPETLPHSNNYGEPDTSKK